MHAIACLRSTAMTWTWGAGLLAMASGACLVAGFLTPAAALAAAVASIGVGLSLLPPPTEVLGAAPASWLVATMTATVVLLGPGAYSIDSRLFGRREAEKIPHEPRDHRYARDLQDPAGRPGDDHRARIPAGRARERDREQPALLTRTRSEPPAGAAAMPALPAGRKAGVDPRRAKVGRLRRTRSTPTTSDRAQRRRHAAFRRRSRGRVRSAG